MPAEPGLTPMPAWCPCADLRGGAGLQGHGLWGVEERAEVLHTGIERFLADAVLGVRKVVFRLFFLMYKRKLQLSRSRLCAR